MSESITIDGHCDSIQNWKNSSFSVSGPADSGHQDIDRMKKGKLDAQFFACWIHPDKKEQYSNFIYKILDSMRRIADNHRQLLQVTSSAREIRENKRKNRISIIPCVEGGYAIENRLFHLRNFARLGVRYMTLAWMNNHRWAGGSWNQTPEKGLTSFGRKVIQEMNRWGILVDLSHASISTFWDAIEESSVPVIASHSCCRALNDHHRNLTDEQLEAIADSGGVVGICFYPAYLDEHYAHELRSYREKQESDDWLCSLPTEKRPDVPLQRLVDHIEYAVEKAGIDHVGLGSDFDGVNDLPGEMSGCDDLPFLKKLLKKRGFEKSEIRQIFGENFLRVLQEAETAATRGRFSR